jgi:tRNA nucleotidyltransferase (CCA-adding enzyme)
MEVYEVGGAVRDALLGLPVTDRDWVVVGATAEELLAAGYRPVGKDFPVFLHPHTAEQYALARTESKVAPGYAGFEFNTAPDITLEQDLQRRDLTINAMARDEHGELIDPCGGRRDIENRLLRHVGNAFREDPVRLLRVARFLARFEPLGFTVAPETLALIRDMVTSGEVDALRPERVWQETEKALSEPRPDLYFQLLRECGALARVFPEIDALFGVPQPRRWHPEIDTGVHTLMALRMAARLSDVPAIRFAVLVHDLGKAATPAETLPQHNGHEEHSARIIIAMEERLPVPRAFMTLALRVARFHGLAHKAQELKPSTIYKLIMAVDGLRQPGQFEHFLIACEADARGRTGLEDDDYPQARSLRDALRAAQAVPASDVARKTGLSGPALGAKLREARIAAIRAAMSGRGSST